VQTPPSSAQWRVILRLVRIVSALIACLPGHYACRLLRIRSPWPRIFLGWVGRIAGLRVTRVGKPLKSHVLLLANHVSWLDIMLLAGTTGCVFISKKEVARWPIAGWLAGLNETIFIDRAGRTTVHDQAEVLRAALVAGTPIALFPEGTTEGGIDVLPFRASLLAALFPPIPGVSVQPVAIDYHVVAHDIAWVGDERADVNAMRVLGRRGTIPVTLHFLEPVDPAHMASRKELAAAARAETIAAMQSAATGGSPSPADRLYAPR
jgi:1-acyl-sn-glycerol-3-phosphate acyltransferase